MNSSQEQPINEMFIEGELSEEDLKQIAGGLTQAQADALVKFGYIAVRADGRYEAGNGTIFNSASEIEGSYPFDEEIELPEEGPFEYDDD